MGDYSAVLKKTEIIIKIIELNKEKKFFLFSSFSFSNKIILLHEKVILGLT